MELTELTWFRRPSADHPGRLNLGYNALDRHVVSGGADRIAVVGTGGMSVDFAHLLAGASHLGAAVSALGTEVGATVLVALADPVDEVVALLAVARIGGVLALGDPDHPDADAERLEPHMVLSSTPLDTGGHAPATCIVRGAAPADPERDLDWRAAMRAGGEGSSVVGLAPGEAAYVVDGRTVPVADALGDEHRPGRLLAALVAGGPVDLRGGPV